jgi:hypothetical protein
MNSFPWQLAQKDYRKFILIIVARLALSANFLAVELQ